jgi:hypothetical protein
MLLQNPGAEIDAYRLVCDDRSNGEQSKSLGISPATIIEDKRLIFTPQCVRFNIRTGLLVLTRRRQHFSDYYVQKESIGNVLTAIAELGCTYSRIRNHKSSAITLGAIEAVLDRAVKSFAAIETPFEEGKKAFLKKNPLVADELIFFRDLF